MRLARPAVPTTYNIGDTLPVLQIYSAPGTSTCIDSRDWKGKLIILDFWSLSCYSCIAAMPKLDSLQQLFSDRLQIVLVTKDKAVAVDKFFARGKFNRPQVSMVVEDSLLSALFPHEFVPYHVWISEQGVVKYITGGGNASKETVTAYFRGQALSFTNKVSLPDIDLQQPIWREGSGRLSHHVRYYSMLSGYLTEYPYYYFRIDEDVSGVRSLSC